MTTRTIVLALAVLINACAQDESVDEQEQAICNCNVPPPEPCCCETPVVLDLAGDGIKLSGWRDGVMFALNPRVGPTWRAWTEPDTDDAWLFLDHTGDGLPNDGLELFGGVTEQPKPSEGQRRNGFLALAQHDDGDGVIRVNDPVFIELRLWTDTDHDGVATSSEVSTLASHGITGLSVDYDEPSWPDTNGNLFRYAATVETTAGSKVAPTAWDVSLTSPTPAERKMSSLPDPVPPSATPPPEPATLERANSAACSVQGQLGVVTHNAVDPLGWGTAKTRSQWYTTSSVMDLCPLYANPAAIKIYQWHLGQWRKQAENSGQRSQQSWLETYTTCRFPWASDWRGWASWNFDPPYAHLNMGGWGPIAERNCSRYQEDSDDPPCHGGEIP